MLCVARAWVLLIVCLALGGCSLSQFNTSTPPNTYDLVSNSLGSPSSRANGLQVIVSVPTAVRAYETDRIMVKPGPVQISYYGNAVWSDRLPSLLQARLVEALQVTGRFRAVASSREKIDPDVALSTDVRAFHVEVTSPASAVAKVDLMVKIIDRRGRLVGSKGFSSQVSVGTNSVAAAVQALNQANHDVLAQVGSWAGRQSRQYAAR